MRIASVLWRKPQGRLSGIGTAGFLLGGALLIGAGYIHFQLWGDKGYRHIPIIGPLFIMQSVSALILGLAAIFTRRLLIAIFGLGLAVLTVVGFLISVSHGVFGFQDSWLAPDAHLAFIVEATAAVVFLATIGLCLLGRSAAGTPDLVHSNPQPNEAVSGSVPAAG
jgi:hypothetical protein